MDGGTVVMLCSYVRSSSLINFSFCQNQYYLTYVLGLDRKVGKKAIKGNITHKVLECLANIKLQHQNTNSTNWIFEDECLSKPLQIYYEDLTQPYPLSNTEVEEINRTRINKWNYQPDAKLQPGHIRYGKELVETIIEEVYAYYTQTDYDWQPVDLKDVTNWVWMTLDYKNGIFDPRKRKIIEPEINFNFEINKPWSHYDFTVNGKNFSGNLTVRGTIDLVCGVKRGIIEICDYKSGQRLDWITGKQKDYKSLQSDLQLMLYYWAAKQLFPKKEILTTIFWIRDGGPFTFAFDEDTIEKTEKMLEKKFKEICQCVRPTMVDPFQKCFKCTKICDYYKMESPDPKRNMCRFINDSIREVGIDTVTELYNRGNFNVYQCPGEI